MTRIHADDFASLAARRAWLDGLPKTRTRITTTPTQKRLNAANDNRRAATLEAVDALLAPHVPDAIADPYESADVEAHGAGWRMRPGVGEIAAAMQQRVAVRTAAGRTHRERWAHRTWHIGPLVFTVQARTERGAILREGKVVTGDIRVPAGALIERGQGKRGALKPSEYRTFEKSPKDEAAGTFARIGRRAIREYLKLPGDWGHRECWAHRVAGDAPPLIRTDSARAASAELAARGLDGGIPFEAARENAGLTPAGKCPPGIWWGADWIGIVARPHHGGTGHDRHAKRAQDEACRILTQRWLAEEVPAEDWRVLSLATSSATAYEAGRELGITRQRYVERTNAALDRVADALMAA